MVVESSTIPRLATLDTPRERCLCWLPFVMRQEDPASTTTLVQRIRGGDTGARDVLIRRYLPALQRWARGRLPRRAGSMADTDDLVQLTLMRALERVDQFEPRETGSFLAYLRKILINKVRDEIRYRDRRPEATTLPAGLPAPEASALETVIARDQLDAYEQALTQLTGEQQEAVILRVECGCSYREVAEAIGSPSDNAARMCVVRALVKISEVMNARQ